VALPALWNTKSIPQGRLCVRIMLIKDIIPDYLKYLQTLNRSPLTIRVARYDLQAFIRFLEAEQIFHIENLTREVLEEYQQELAFHLTAKGSLLSPVTQSKTLTMIRGFTRFIREKDYLLHDPGEAIKLPKKAKRLPKVILDKTEMKRLLNAPDIQTNNGYRDRIILEILYDTAIRRAEIAAIKVSDLDLNAGYIHIRGKGDKERIVPLSKRICELTQNYILFVRPFFAKNDDGHLILNYQGQRMGERSIWKIVKHNAHVAKIKKTVTPHSLRHTCATHMLRNGAPVRHLQEMLGHASLNSTQVYTRVTINDLKEIHAKYHPSAA